MTATRFHCLCLLVAVALAGCADTPADDEHGLAVPDTIMQDTAPLLPVPPPLQQRQ